jgi:hypothetical protein
MGGECSFSKTLPFLTKNMKKFRLKVLYAVAGAALLAGFFAQSPERVTGYLILAVLAYGFAETITAIRDDFFEEDEEPAITTNGELFTKEAK